MSIYTYAYTHIDIYHNYNMYGPQGPLELARIFLEAVRPYYIIYTHTCTYAYSYML